MCQGLNHAPGVPPSLIRLRLFRPGACVCCLGGRNQCPTSGLGISQLCDAVSPCRAAPSSWHTRAYPAVGSQKRIDQNRIEQNKFSSVPASLAQQMVAPTYERCPQKIHTDERTAKRAARQGCCSVAPPAPIRATDVPSPTQGPGTCGGGSKHVPRPLPRRGRRSATAQERTMVLLPPTRRPSRTRPTGRAAPGTSPPPPPRTRAWSPPGAPCPRPGTTPRPRSSPTAPSATRTKARWRLATGRGGCAPRRRCPSAPGV